MNQILAQANNKNGTGLSSNGEPSVFLSEDGMPYPDAQRETRPVVAPSLADKLVNMDPSDMVRVTIFLKNQPQAVISREIRQKHETELEAIRKEIRAIRDKYAARRNEQAATDAENYSHEVLALGSEDRLALDALNERQEAVSLKITREMSAALRSAVESDQVSIKALIAGHAGDVEYTTIAVNAIIARIPAGSVDRIAAFPIVSRIADDRVMEIQLTNAARATLVTTTEPGGGLWDNGYCGGAYDPAVLDTGADLSHPALEDSASRTNYYSYYLTAAYSDPYWHDELGIDDLHGHGTGVQSIVSSYYPNFLGMANCVDKSITLKAGWRGIDDEGNEFATMYRSDSMALVDRALYETDHLHPWNSFNDEVDGINLSFGSAAEDDSGTPYDEDDYSRFFDSIISTYQDLVVTVSAGNSGPDNTVFQCPACSYNVITVANVDDGNTPDRYDDTIYDGDGIGDPEGSTRGPTLNGRRKPDIAAPGTQINKANNDWEEDGEYKFENGTGTSYAAPMIQGIAMDLMHAGVIDELEIKALLLNTAQKNNPNIDFESDEDGWSEAYGWGYVNALEAYYHVADVRTDSVTPRGTAGDIVFYKGQMKDERPTGQGRDRVTLVWNRHVDYNPGSNPTTYYGLSDLNLWLYNESNGDWIDSDKTLVDNVHQVRVDSGAQDTDVVVKVRAYSTSFAHGGDTEEFALATEENFVKVDFPDSFVSQFGFPSVMEPNEEADLIFTLRNTSDIASHFNHLNLLLPDGWTLVSGADVIGVGSISAGDSTSVTWRLRAPSIAVGSQTILVKHLHHSYGHAWWDYPDWAVTVETDVTPPLPDPMTWATEPYETSTSEIQMVATAATDLHTPVEYYFWASDLTDGGGSNSSGWVTNATYTDDGLGTNHQYRYWVLARDAAATPNLTAWSVASDEYTAIEASTGVTFGTKTSTSIDVRSTNTPSGLTRGSSGLIVLNETADTGSGWKQDNAYWTSTGLSPNRQYCFVASSRNGDETQTGLSPGSCVYTLADAPTSFTFSAISENSIQVNWQPGSNPEGTEYFVENTTNGDNSGWTTALNWDNTGLECSTSYSYRIKARNGDRIETVWIAMGNATSNACQVGITGIWPASATVGEFISVFIFGDNFTTDNTTEVYFNGIRQWLVSPLTTDMLIVRVLVSEDLFGPVTVTTPSGSETSTQEFGIPLAGLNLTGVWPSDPKIGESTSIFLFGTEFTTDGSSEVYFNGVRQWLVAPVTSEMLIVRVLGDPALSGIVTVVTPSGTTNSSEPLVFVP